MPKSTLRAEERHYGQLIGKTVKHVIRAPAEGYVEEGWGLEFTDGTVIWILSDPEGNGTGWLEIVRPGQEQLPDRVTKT